ncbi:hypothetical protein PQQ51_33495 [Paraburkholderia xenovorans]|uniref:hypothetical protein n=1 Tax=Paraburkholderia xenovorans TaxID=36873 RepID=UPI0038B8D616
MQIFGVHLRKPTFVDVTVMAATATVLLVVVLAVCAFSGYHPGAYAKALFLASLAWGVLSNLIGIRVMEGWRHLALNTAGCVAINLSAVAVAAVASH